MIMSLQYQKLKSLFKTTQPRNALISIVEYFLSALRQEKIYLIRAWQ